ncbi:MAG: AAA family ATPase [Halioglobus sp.]
MNPRYLFMSARHRDALAHLLYGVGAGGGFILLTGEVGTGKTTINRCLLEQLPANTDVAMILNPALNAIELLASVCDELGIANDPEKHTLKTLTDKLHAFLLENHARGRKTVLLIDEAQHLDFDVLEQIRLLTNLETNSEKLLQIILIGQPELAQLLARPELRQLNQRITARYNLDPLNLDETGAYIQHRLQVAGMSPERVIFTPSVVRGIYKATRGIPRVINVLCDRMLLGAYGRNKSRADHAMLQLAKQEVLGEQAAATATWRWLAAAVVILLLVWLGGWLLGNYTAGPGVERASTQAAPPTPRPADTAGAVPVPPPGEVEPSPVAPGEPAAGQTPEPDVTPETAVATEAATIAGAMQPADAVMGQLWALNSEQPVPAVPVPGVCRAGWPA